MSGKTLLIRADANAEIGAGHVMRCVALAQAWQKAGGRAIFALTAGAGLEGRIRSEGSDFETIHATPGTREDAAHTAQLCASLRADWLVVDGYHFPAEYRRSVRTLPARLLLFDDDAHGEARDCDLALNPDPDAVLRAPAECKAVQLRGPQYALLRREFLDFRSERPSAPETARRILITLGGGDSHNVTQQVFDALERLSDLDLDVTVIVGSSYPYAEQLQAALRTSPLKAKLLQNVDNMPALMSRADLAISAGGGTCYELAFMQVPMFLITMAKNHEAAVEALASAGVAFNAGWFSSLNREGLAGLLRKVVVDRELRAGLVKNAAGLVDGNGANRVVEAMNAISRRATNDVV
jgi:UDP-2,4-diacetamido-2,4,6-trideoxy-beta-L-altropyranose hydrolase